jgi:hypothetical protein
VVAAWRGGAGSQLLWFRFFVVSGLSLNVGSRENGFVLLTGVCAGPGAGKIGAAYLAVPSRMPSRAGCRGCITAFDRARP